MADRIPNPYDLERQTQGATKLSTSAFGRAIVENI
jgi:hypothetical protein